MKIRRLEGPADGWAVAVALGDFVVYDEDGKPNGVTKGKKYYTQGDLDPALFEVENKPKLKVVKGEEVGE